MHESSDHSAQSRGMGPVGRWAAGGSGHTDLYQNVARWLSSGAFQQTGRML